MRFFCRRARVSNEDLERALRSIFGPHIVEHPDGSVELFRYDGAFFASFGPLTTPQKRRLS